MSCRISLVLWCDDIILPLSSPFSRGDLLQSDLEPEYFWRTGGTPKSKVFLLRKLISRKIRRNCGVLFYYGKVRRAPGSKIGYFLYFSAFTPGSPCSRTWWLAQWWRRRPELRPVKNKNLNKKYWKNKALWRNSHKYSDDEVRCPVLFHVVSDVLRYNVFWIYYSNF